jgi:hypothetical protein
MSTPESTGTNTFTMGNPMPGSTLALCQSRLYPPVRNFGFGLRICALYCTVHTYFQLFSKLDSPPPSQSIFKKRKTRNIPFFTYNFLTYACFMHVHYCCSYYSAYIGNQKYFIINIFREKFWISATLATVFSSSRKLFRKTY